MNKKTKIVKIIISVLLIELLVLTIVFQYIYPKASLPNAKVPFERIGITSSPLNLFIHHGLPSKTPEYNDINGFTSYAYDDIKICDLSADAYYEFHSINIVYISYNFKTSKDNQDEIFNKVIKLCDEELLVENPEFGKNFIKSEEIGKINYELGSTCSEEISIEKRDDSVYVLIEFVY